MKFLIKSFHNSDSCLCDKELFVIINKDRILVFPLVMITLSTKL